MPPRAKQAPSPEALLILALIRHSSRLVGAMQDILISGARPLAMLARLMPDDDAFEGPTRLSQGPEMRWLFDAFVFLRMIDDAAP